jgi:hypothetical protein
MAVRIFSLVASLALLACGTARAESTIASLDKPTPVRTFGGNAVLSLYDRATDTYRLAVSRGGRAPQPLPVAPSKVAFDADIGPGPDGTAALVYSRCAVASVVKLEGCDLFLYDLHRNAERRLAATAAAGWSERTPTIWRSRIAFARYRDARPEPRPRLLIRRVNAPASTRSQSVPGVPTKRCGRDTSTGRCEATSGRIEELELWGRWLGVIPVYHYPSAGGVCGTWEVRAVSLSDRKAQKLDDVTCGLDGQTWVGLSFAHGRLAATLTRAGEESERCVRRFGAYRFALTGTRTDYACADRRIEGFALLSTGRAYEVRAPDTRDGYCGNSLEGEFPQCQFVLTDPLAFRRVPRR